MRIDRYNYAQQFGTDAAPLIEELGRMILSGRYILTDEVNRFEQAFQSYLNVPFALGVNSGTDALMLALMALGVGPGDEVITQANTFYATVAAIRLVGATPVLVDALEDSFLMNVEQLGQAITPRTRVILPVHLYGKPTPMHRLLELARAHECHIVEDACQAHGAHIEGRRCGTFGAIGCFSFHPSKNLAAAGDGGALVTASRELDERLRQKRELGQCGQNVHVTLGMNSKLDALQARILSWKLPHLDEWNAGRRRIAEQYRRRLSDLPLTFQPDDPGHVYHLFQVRTVHRDELLAHLKSQGVDCVVRYPHPIHLQAAFADCGWKSGEFPVAEALARELLCLPIRPDMIEAEVAYVADQVRAFFG